ncbi:hypothetical protein [Lacticaseibacillus sp. N501-2]|uniref:hypothetical protein n=1 Tax=Lacticaseibacillus salsurae TaxID=3367729 RepID=UPI0038B23D3A
MKPNREHLKLTGANLATIGVWALLLIITLVVRAHKPQVHTPVTTTLGNYVMMLLPLAIIWTLPQDHRRRRWLVVAWAWFALMAYLQIWH